MLSFPKPYSILWILFLAFETSAQTYKSLPHHMNYHNFSVNLNYIYNHSSYTKEISNLYVIKSNYNGPDSAYFETHQNLGARTFGLNISYNKPLAKRLSISIGLGLNQKKQITKFTLYEDKNPDKPDLTNIIYDEYSLILPVTMNFYYRRFILSAGHSFYYGIIQKNTHNYQDNSQKIIDANHNRFRIYLQESISFQLIQNKGLYLKASAEQTSKFYNGYGYNNWFMLGGTYYF